MKNRSLLAYEKARVFELDNKELNQVVGGYRGYTSQPTIRIPTQRKDNSCSEMVTWSNGEADARLSCRLTW